jgi:methionyl aminopeptidase
MIHLKSPKQINIMREGGKRLNHVLQQTLQKIKPGISTLELNDYTDRLIRQQGGEASFKLVEGYRWATCICINDCVVHGIPKKDELIKNNDVVTIDMGMLYQGFNTDVSWTVYIKDPKIQRSKDSKEMYFDTFLETGKRALNKAISQVKVGNRIGHISKAIESTIEAEGYSVAEELVGHGVGKKLHEDPEIPGILMYPIFRSKKLAIGMTLAIEVIYMEGNNSIYVDADGWTIRTKDGTIASCFEKTVALTGSGCIILT